MNTKQILFLSIFLLAGCCGAIAQPKPELLADNEESSATAPAKYKQFLLGGVAGMTFGDFTELRLSALIGYRLSRSFSAGVNATYRMSWDKQVTSSQEEVTATDNSFGGGAYFQYNPAKEFYLMSEYSYQKYNTETTQGKISRDVNFLFLGAGYTKELSRDVFLNAGVKVDVLNDQDSPFSDFQPFFEVSIVAGL
ncbi:MAG: porin family protein [Ignavibacteria bacterium]|nr:porin family protein [Ignavibacteria bacterium]